MQTLSDIKSLLAARGLQPKHRFGQNFLHDHNHMSKIIAGATLSPGDVVLEVGPGTGALTEWLLDADAAVVASEIDSDMAAILSQRIGERFPDRFELVEGDILSGKHTIAPAVMAAVDRRRGSAPFKLIANLPYHIASPLLANLAVDHPAMSLAIVMVQREVADRLNAPPGGKDYGPLGVIIQALCEVDRICVLPPSCFWPQPTIDSAVIRLRRRQSPLTDDPAALSRMLQVLFTKRRKQLGSILGRDFPFPKGIDPNARPESLSVAQLVLLSVAQPRITG